VELGGGRQTGCAPFMCRHFVYCASNVRALNLFTVNRAEPPAGSIVNHINISRRNGLVQNTICTRNSFEVFDTVVVE